MWPQARSAVLAVSGAGGLGWAEVLRPGTIAVGDAVRLVHETVAS